MLRSIINHFSVLFLASPSGYQTLNHCMPLRPNSLKGRDNNNILSISISLSTDRAKQPQQSFIKDLSFIFTPLRVEFCLFCGCLRHLYVKLQIHLVGFQWASSDSYQEQSDIMRF